MNDASHLADMLRAIAEGKAVDASVSDTTPADESTASLIAELQILSRIAAVHGTALHDAKASPDSDGEPMSSWGPLAILECVGRGSYGDVYRAWDTRLDREVALKLQRRPTAPDAPHVIEEGRLLARVRHPNAITVHGADCIDGRTGVWMEFIEGRTLEEELHARGPLPPAEVAALGIDVCRALEAVHKAGVIHRDIKAQNVMRESTGRTVLMDFGSGLSEGSGDAIGGTPLYLAPEALAGGAATIRSDIYAVGVLLYHLLTGRYPVEGGTLADIRAHHRQGRLRSIREIQPSAPKRLCAVIVRAMATDPAQRYESAAAFEVALERTISRTPARTRTVAAAVIALVAIGSPLVWIASARRDDTVRTTRDAGVTTADPGGPALHRLWAGPKVDLLGSVSPDGRLFSVVDWTTGNLLVHDFATGTDRDVTGKGTWAQSETFAEESVFSPDGHKVAYAWFNGQDRFEIRVVDLRTPNLPQPRRLYDDPSVEWIAPYDWSPDGRYVAVGLARKDGTYQVGVLTADTGALRISKTTGRRGAEKMVFSPDGRYLAFHSGGGGVERDVVIVAVDGTRETRITPTAGEDFIMGWSRDDDRLLFASNRGGPMDLWAQRVVDGVPRGNAEVIKSDISPWSLGLSANGSLHLGVHVGNRNVQIAPMDFRTGKLVGAPVRVADRFIGFNVQPEWSRDGKYLTYISVRHRIGSDRVVVIRTVDTGEVRETAVKLARIRDLRAVEPGGKSFLMHGSDMDGRDAIYRIDVSTGKPTPVVLGAHGGFVGPPQLSRDGTTLFFARKTRTGETAFIVRELASGREREIVRRSGLGGVSLSPDDRLIAAVASDQAARVSAIVIVPVAGGPLREVLRTDTREFEFGNAIAWVPDQRYVVVRKDSTTDAATSQALLVSLAGNEPPRALELPGRITGAVRVSPNGRDVAYVAGEFQAEVWKLENFLPRRRD